MRTFSSSSSVLDAKDPFAPGRTTCLVHGPRDLYAKICWPCFEGAFTGTCPDCAGPLEDDGFCRKCGRQMRFVRQQLLEAMPFGDQALLLERAIVVPETSPQSVVVQAIGRPEHCVGHFPGNPILPGHIILEMANQAAGVALLAHGYDKRPNRVCLFRGVTGAMRFRRPIPIVDQVVLTFTAAIKMIAASSITMFSAEVRAVANGQPVFGATGIQLTIVSQDDPPVSR